MLMYQLLNGVNSSKPPYEINSIKKYNPKLSETLEKIVEKCTCFNSDKRYENCAELISDLQNGMT